MKLLISRDNHRIHINLYKFMKINEHLLKSMEIREIDELSSKSAKISQKSKNKYENEW